MPSARTSLLLLALSSVSLAQDEKETVVVGTQFGSVEGLVVKGEEGDVEHYSFKGIPFAEPPVGQLRFRDPVPHRPWVETRNATEFGAQCMQQSFWVGNETKFSEDCLFINVFTPTLPARRFSWVAERSAYKPVMVWIHGGGFTEGSGDSYPPDFLVEKDVVLVTFNYRLTLFGFFNLEHPLAPGNLGLKDQILALQWVKANIAFFGGDPNRVTIFGESAGGASVHAHILSPQGDGLFQGAIMQSGTAYIMEYTTLGRRSEKSSQKLLEAFGCPKGKMEALQCMQKVDADEMMETIKSDALNIMGPFEENLVNGTFHYNFGVSVDKFSTQPFFPESPLTLLLNNQFKRIPVMTGVAKYEGALFTAIEWDNMDIASKHLGSYIGYSYYGLDAEDITPEIKTQAEVIRQFYLNGRNFSRDLKFEINDLYSDIQFDTGMYLTSLKHSATGAPVYVYYLTHKPSVSFGNLYGAATSLGDEDLGVTHSDDVSFLFPAEYFGGLNPIVTEDDKKTKEEMLMLWTNFAKYLDPTPFKNKTLKWKPFSKESENFMELKAEPELKEGFNPKRMYFMRKVLFDQVEENAKASQNAFPVAFPFRQSPFFF